MRKVTILFLSLALVMVLTNRALATMSFELDFGQDDIFENSWDMRLNDIILVDVYASNVPTPGLLSIGIRLAYDPHQLQVAPATAVDTANWELGPPVIFGEGEVTMKGGRLLPGLEGDRIKLGTFALKCINPGSSELWLYDSDKQGSYDDFVLSDGTVLDGELEGGVLVANVNNVVIMTLNAGWSMISLPVDPLNKTLNAVFPGAVVVYRYEKGTGYVRVGNNDDLEVGKGYWILLNEEHIYTLAGKYVQEHTCPVENGWYMIGGGSSSAQAAVGSGNIKVLYGYAPGVGYQRRENIEPGKGYWILLSGIMGQGELRVACE